MPICFMSFCFNAPCQFRALLHLRALTDTNQITDSSNIRLNYDKVCMKIVITLQTILIYYVQFKYSGLQTPYIS